MTSKRLWLQIARHEIQREATEENAVVGLTEERGAGGKPAIMILCSVL